MKKRVLVVDDSELVLDKAREWLEKAGFDVDTAHSAMDSDRYVYGCCRPDIVIMDVMMPVLDGDKKAKILKEEEATRDIPILLLSSKNETELCQLVKESMTEGFIRKPFTPEQLLGKIRETLHIV